VIWHEIARAYIVTRILLTIPMLFILVTLVFFMVRIMPGDPVGGPCSGLACRQEVSDQIRHSLGLDMPLFLNSEVARPGYCPTAVPAH